MPVWELIGLVGRSIPQAFVNIDFLLITAIVLSLIYSQYHRMGVMEINLLGIPWTNPWAETLSALGYGIIGGFLASMVFIGLGIPLSETGLWYVWPLALFLMFVNPRLLCFSYAGGLLALSNLLFGWPELNVAAIMALVAVLHMVEAALIYLGGHRTPSPVYVRCKDGEVVGGLSMQKFWPLPILTLVLVAVAGEIDGADLVSMPDWWPLIKSHQSLVEGTQLVYLLFPMMAALGYGDLCLSRLPREKARRTAISLAIYSLVLLGLAIGSTHIPLLLWVVALAAPLGHEFIVFLGRRSEHSDPPMYVSHHGAMILAVRPGSPAEAMGLMTGDIIVSINDYPVASGREVHEVILPWVIDPTIRIKGGMSGKGDRVVRYRGKIPPLGVVFVPESNVERALVLQPTGSFVRRLGPWRRPR